MASKSQMINELVKVTDLGGMTKDAAKKVLADYSEDQLAGLLADARAAKAGKKSSAKKSSAKKSSAKKVSGQKKASAQKTAAPKRGRRTAAKTTAATTSAKKSGKKSAAKAQAAAAQKAAAQAAVAQQAARKAAAAAQQAAAAAKKTSVKKTSAKKTSSGKKSGARKARATGTAVAKTSARKMPKELVSRVRTLEAAIARGAIAAKQGKAKAGDMAGTVRRQKYEKFVALYAGARVKGVKAGGSEKSVGITQRYKSIAGSKRPYFLSPGYHVPGYSVGGGAKGPGIVRTIPGTKAKSFQKLSLEEQKKVCSFLNGAGTKLRSKGAPKKAECAEIRQHLGGKKKTTAQASAGGANRW